MTMTREDRKMIQEQFEMRERIHKLMIDKLKELRGSVWEAGRFARGRGYRDVTTELEKIGRSLVDLEANLLTGKW